MGFPFLKKDGLKKQDTHTLNKTEIAKLIGTTPKALADFEASYKKHVLDGQWDNGTFFNISSRQIKGMMPAQEVADDAYTNSIVGRIINELMAGLQMMEWDGKQLRRRTEKLLPAESYVTKADLELIPKKQRPQLAGDLVSLQINEDTAGTLLYNYAEYLKADDPKKKRMYYHLFRQGLDILDLDGLTYEMLGMNPNAMGHWLPGLTAAVQKQEFFRIPKTKVMKVPLPLLQLSRIDYELLTPTTMRIVDEFCFEAFGLDEEKEYFVKTGTFSSKFDFRNAHVHGAKEVRELGEYLLYISNTAVQMAGPLSTPSVYGVSTTNEWVVREYIPDTEGNPCIYKGMPLRTEYRVFVDFDSNEILGISPYWEPKLMEKRFSQGADARNPHDFHDYVVFKNHKEILMQRYQENKDKVLMNLSLMLPNFGMKGQWSIDVMQSGRDFHVIDMALAATSALSECVPQGKLRPAEENWLPCIGKIVEGGKEK